MNSNSKTFSEKDGFDRFVSTTKAAGEPWNKEINFHFECVEGDGFPENQEFFYFSSVQVFVYFTGSFCNLGTAYFNISSTFGHSDHPVWYMTAHF